MRKYKGIKLLLFGIALIAFSQYAALLMDGDQTVFSSIIAGFGAFSPLIGLAFCIAGLFVKDGEDKPKE